MSIRLISLVCALLFFSMAAFAGDFYVATSGSDTNPGTIERPYATLAKGVSGLKPGDRLLIRAGTYPESLAGIIPGGTSWDSPVTVAAYQNERVVLVPPAGAAGVLRFANSAQAYIVVEGLVLDASNVSYDAVKITVGSGVSHHIRIKNCEVMHSPNQGLLLTGGAEGNEFINLKVHDNGKDDFDHGFYISTSNNLIEGCEIYRNSGWGVHIYSGTPNNNIVRDSFIHDNARTGDRGPGIGVYTGSGNSVYNNKVWNNNGGIYVRYGATRTTIFNNLVYNNSGAGIDLSSEVSDTQIFNNTCYDNAYGIGVGVGSDFVSPVNTTSVINNLLFWNKWQGIYVGASSTGAIVRNNCIYKNTRSYGDESNLYYNFLDRGVETVKENNFQDKDPLLQNPAGADFRLTMGSPALDAGLALPQLTEDLEHLKRPQGAGYDIGAYEGAVRPLAPARLEVDR
jgi:parallel beta-helix repeat protein